MVAHFCEVPGFPRALLVGVESVFCYDGVDVVWIFLRSLGLRRKAPPRSGRYEGVSVVVLGVAGVPRHHRLPRVPCFPEGVGDVEKVAPPRTLVSSSVGVVGASSAWFFVGVVEVIVELRVGRVRR